MCRLFLYILAMSSNIFESVTTRAGDEGKTSLANGERRYKSELVFEAMGDIDELTSALGLLKLHLGDVNEGHGIHVQIYQIQQALQRVMALVAKPSVDRVPEEIAIINEKLRTDLGVLEDWEHKLLKDFAFEGFIIPGAATIPAWCDLARTICRRAERHLVRFIHESYTEHLRDALAFVNRLSDYLWVLGRYWARLDGVSEI